MVVGDSLVEVDDVGGSGRAVGAGVGHVDCMQVDGAVAAVDDDVLGEMLVVVEQEEVPGLPLLVQLALVQQNVLYPFWFVSWAVLAGCMVVADSVAVGEADAAVEDEHWVDNVEPQDAAGNDPDNLEGGDDKELYYDLAVADTVEVVGYVLVGVAVHSAVAQI